MRKLHSDEFRVCLSPIIFANKYQEARNYTRTGQNKNTILHCSGRDRLVGVGVDVGLGVGVCVGVGVGGFNKRIV
jgi:hypothetical protein